MSITSLADDEIRRVEQPALRERSLESTLPVSGQASNALDALVKYIPTESVTLYVAAVSATPALKATLVFVNEARLYWFFVVLTPVLFILIYAGKRVSLSLPPLPSLREWPWWKLFAATVAFLVWALAVPTNPYIAGPLQGAVAGFAAILVSTFLSLLEPLFDKKPA